MNRIKLSFLSMVAMMVLAAALPAQAGEQKTILCSTFPILHITRNVVGDRSGVIVQPLLPATLGCPHDYALTPQDMRKLAQAEVLIVNGLGMEEYLGAPVARANPRLKIVDSSKGIEGLIAYEEDGHEEGEHGAGHNRDHDREHAGPGEARPEHDHGHEHAGANPHLFTSPRLAGRLAMNIAGELARLDPAAAGEYLANARAYAEKMNVLADDFSALGRRLGNNRIVTQHGIFDYLARDMGLKVVAVVQEHAGQEPSAAKMLAIVNTVQAKKAGAIFTEPQYPAKVGQTIAREAGIATATLDPVASGPENAPLDYYETVMRQNLRTLERTLGAK